MTDAIKFPAIRQPATEENDQGVEIFTRPWYLFFQQLYQRTGGAISQNNSDLEASLFEDAGVSETNASLFSAEQAAGQLPYPQLVQLIENLQAELSAQRDTIAELVKEIDSIKQGQMI
jgi:hypothetical protein